MRRFELGIRSGRYAPEQCAQTGRDCEPYAPGTGDQARIARAYYSPADDHVGMPTRERFQREEEYFSTLFHELVHKAATRIMRRQWLGALIRQAFRCGYAA